MTRTPPRANAVSPSPPPRPRAAPIFLPSRSPARAFFRGERAFNPKIQTRDRVPPRPPSSTQCRVTGCDAICQTVHEIRARACASHCAALYVQLEEEPEGTQSRFCYQCHKFHTMDEYITPDGSLLQRHNCYKSQQRRLMRRRNKSNEKAAANKTHGGRGRGRNQGANPQAYYLSRAAGANRRSSVAGGAEGGIGAEGGGGGAPGTPSPMYAHARERNEGPDAGAGGMMPPPPRRVSGGVLIEPVTYANYEEPVAKTYQELLPPGMRAEAEEASRNTAAMDATPAGGAGGPGEMTEEMMRRLREEAVRAHNAQTLRFGSFTESSLKPRTAPSAS